MMNLRSRRRVRSAVKNAVESLESRQLLSATLVSAIPAQNLSANTSTTVNLTTYLDDPSITSDGTVIEMQTPLGNIPLELTNTQTPKTVANFIQYITNGEYTPTIIQRSAPGFVLQGGGTKPDGSSNAPLADVVSEAGISNTAGTIAMALSTGPNSGNNQWFINLGDNASSLDGTADGGPFTVFGNVIDGGMTVANSIAALQIINGSAENSNWYIGPDDGLPVINYNGSSAPTSVPEANLVTDNIVELTGSAAGPSYSAVSANPLIATAVVNDGKVTITPAAGVTSGTTTITATVTDLSGGTATSTFNVTIGSAAALPTVSIANASANAGSGAQLEFPVSLSADTTSNVTLDYSLSPGTASSADYSATSSTLTILAGETSAEIPVDIVGDTLGASETFTITLSDPSSNVMFTGGSSTATATGTILPAVGTTVATTTTLQATLPSVAAGGTDTFVATITPASVGAAPTGTVNFSIGGTSIGSAGVTGGTATLTTTLTTPGDQSVTAVYGGSSSYNASTSNTLTINVSTLAPKISNSTLPSTVIAGVAVHATVMIDATNAISSIQNGIATFNLYASTGNSINSDSVLIATVKKQVKLITGKSITVPIPIKSLPATLAAGTYTLLAQTVDPSGNTSDAATGSSLTITTPVVTLSDSIVKLVQPSAVVAGSKTTAVAQIQITNSGNVASTGTTTISLLASTDGTVADGTVFKTITSKLSIKPGKSAMIAVPLEAYPKVADGNYLIVAEVTDSAGSSSSAEFSTPVNIAAAKIDLAASTLVIPTTGKIGKTIAVTLDLANKGNITATGALGIALSASSSSDGSNSFALATLSTHINLTAGISQVLHLKVPVPAAVVAGSFYLTADVDPNNVFADANLTNNFTVSSTTIMLS